MSQMLPVDSFKWVENTSQHSKNFIENYNEDSDERYLLQVDVQYPEILHDFHSDLPFLPDKIKINKEKSSLSQSIQSRSLAKIMHWY